MKQNPMTPEQAAKWKSDALADRWSQEDDIRVKREGFTAQIRHDSVFVWGSDGLVINPAPIIYSWDALIAGLRHCHHCGHSDVDTVRYSFAGRCCKACLPEMRREHEYPGWTN